MEFDYYKILGVPENASESAIHASYRRLALTFHPQKSHENSQKFVVIFQKINEAFDVLKDPFLREFYDKFGHDGLTTTVSSIPNHPCGYRYHGHPMRTFEQHFGTTSPYADVYVPRDSANDYHLYADIFRARPKGLLPPIVIDLKVTLEELFHGSIREIEFIRHVSGEKASFLSENESFFREEKVTRNVHIRPGWRTGTQIVFEKEGDQAKDKIPSDVFVNIVELPHERFRRDGNDLRMKIEVDLLVALCGGDVTVTSIDETPIRIEETNVIKPGSSRKIPDFGMPVEEDLTIRGNLFLDYFVNFPKNMDLTRREMIANAIKSRRKKPKNLTNLISVK